MDSTSLIVAMLFVVLAFAIVVLAEFAAWRVHVKRTLCHDLNGALTPVLLELDKMCEGMTDDPETVKQLVMAIRGFLRPEGDATIKLFRYLKLISSSYESIEFYSSADPVITADLGDLHRITTNALQNALEARVEAGARQPVRIHLTEDAIKISNPATPADIHQVLSPEPGSTRGTDRGSGLKSIRDSCRRIGWAVEWAVSGTRVITTLRFAC